MDGIIAYILSKKYTNDTVIGMGAIKGAACQVQSINKVNKTTTITLEWEDNVGTSHTQSFDIEDGADGVSVTGATINASGHLILTLSNTNTIDCGQVLPQYDTMPTPSATNEGQILQYIGTTTSNFTNGYFYICESDGVGGYHWVQKLVQDSYTKAEIGDISNLPDNTKNVVENIGVLKLSIDQLSASKLSISDIDNELSDTSENPVQNKVITLAIDQLQGSMLDALAGKEDIFRYNTLPSPSVDIENAIVQYIGVTNANYINGYYYQCVESPVGSGTYIWTQKNVQPNNGGGGGDGVVDGYYNPLNQLFYEDSSFLNPITGEDNTIYVDLNTNGLYRYNGAIFIKVSSSAESIQVDTMPTADSTQLNKIYQYIGATDVNYTNGYFYKCTFDGTNYQWVNIPTQDAYTKAQIGALSDLPDPSKTVIENISALQGSLADIDKEKLDKLEPIYLIGSGLSLDSDPTSPTYGKLTATGMSIPIDDHLDDTSINPVQNKVITEKIDNLDALMATKLSINDVDNALSGTSLNPVQNKVIKLTIDQMQGSILEKIRKRLDAQENNFAIWDNGGEVKDSGISKDIIPSSASSSNKLLVKSDIDSALSTTSENPVQNKAITVPLQALQGSLINKADKVSSATNDDFATLDANGNLKDSGINKNIVPSSATSSNKLATIADIPDELNDLDDVVITTPVNSQILAYNSTSGKWENKTGQETIGGLVFKGSILFANLPTSGMSNGDAYDIKDAFTTDNRFEEGSGIACGAGTDIVWVVSENKWNILTPSGVYSFNGRIGAVQPATSDYDADQVDYDNTISGLTATDVQAAIDEVANEKADKVASATNGHLAGLDSNGNLTDSGVVASNVIEKVATATGLLKDDGTVDTTSYAPSANAYLVGDTAETTIDDADYFPFYDSSATGKRKTLFSSIVNKLKNTFATLVTGTFTADNLVSLDSSGNIADSNISSNDIRKTTALSNGAGDAIFKISGFGLNTGSLFVIRTRGGENILFALGNSSQDVAISYGYSAFRVSGTSAYKINAMTYDYANNELYVNLGNYSVLSIIQISGVTKYNLTITSVNSIPTTDIYEIPIQNLNSKIDKVSATQNDIAIFDANGGVTDSSVLISSLPTIAPTPSSSLDEDDIVTSVNGAINTNSNAPSLYGVQQWSNEKKVRRVLDGSNIPSGTTMTATGIGTWDNSGTPDETDWWYDDAFKITNADDIDLSLKFDPTGEVVTLGGYILDTTSGKICIKFGNSVTISNTKIAVDITYTRNEVS